MVKIAEVFFRHAKIAEATRDAPVVSENDAMLYAPARIWNTTKTALLLRRIGDFMAMAVVLVFAASLTTILVFLIDICFVLLFRT